MFHINRWIRLFAVLVLFVPAVHGQVSSTAPITGTVSDSTGAVIPGATISAKNNGTNAQFQTISIENGAFVIPALTPGLYTVTVSLPGFKVAVISDVKVDAGTPATVRVNLQVGDVTQTVTVEAGAEILQTQTATITTTIDMRQVNSLPVSRNALNLASLLAGVSSTGNERASRVNGLSRSAVNVTIDGINSQEYLKDSDFFSVISPRTDAVEEVSVSSAAPGAEASGQGAVQVKIVTRQGSNEFHGGLSEVVQNSWLNANSWFNNRDLPANPVTGKAPRNRVISNVYGGHVGGPVIKDRVFFFVNMEESRSPSSSTRTQNILDPLTQTGVYQYLVSGTTRQVNLLALASANGQTATPDPTVSKLLADIRSATQTTGGTQPNPADPNLLRYTFQNTSGTTNRFPTVRLDFNLNRSNHLETSWWYQKYNTFPDTLNTADPSFPGFPNKGGQTSDRYQYSAALRSTLTPSIVNEFRFGFANGGLVRFFTEISAQDFVGSVANQQGFALGISAAGISNAYRRTSNSRRSSPSRSLADTLSWQRGAHSISFGVNFSRSDSFLDAKTAVPVISFGVDTNDPANGMFTTANFQGASTTQLAAARSIYAVLTGRVTAINANGIVDEKTGDYTYLGADVQRGRQDELGFFVTDSWRANRNFTMNYGLRWEIQQPYSSLNNRYTQTSVEGLYGISGKGNLFNPTTRTGSKTTITPLKPGESTYNTQWVNLGPSIGFAWSPKIDNAIVKGILGANGVIRGGYAISYIRRSNSLFNDGYANNPGSLLTLNRNTTIGNLVSGQSGDALPVLLRQTTRLGAPAFNKTPVYPYGGYGVTDSVTIFDPHFKVPYVESWTLGIQRELDKSTALEIRYVGNRSLQNAETVNLNETNIIENGFMDEFKRAQANLQANIAAGRGPNFGYYGAGTGTAPLPILLGYLAGSRDTTNVAAYANTNTNTFANTTFVNRLALQNPAPYSLASGMYGNAGRKANGLVAGFAPNFFQANPDLSSVNLIRNGGYTNYNSLVVELRRRLTRGLQLNGSYTWSKTQTSNFLSLRKARYNGISTATAPDIPHVVKANWVFELPFGPGHWLLPNANGLLARVVGGWELNGVARVQTGDPIDVGNFRLIGMTRKDLQKAMTIRFDDAGRVVYSLPEDIIQNTIRANNVSATTATGFSDQGVPSGRYIALPGSPGCVELYSGDCGARNIVVYGPKNVNFDLSLSKKTRITEAVNFEFRAEMYNAFNNTNWSVGLGSKATTFGQVTAADAARSVTLVGRFNF